MSEGTNFGERVEDVALDPHSPAVQIQRFGGKVSLWTVHRAVVDNETTPTNPNLMVRRFQYRSVKFAFRLPANVDACSVHIGRWIFATGKSQDVSAFFEDTVVNITKNQTIEIDVDRDLVGVFIDNITPAGVLPLAAPIAIYHKGIGRVAK